MADAWTTVVHREPEWTPTARAEAIAAVAAEKIVCPSCGNVDTIVEVPVKLSIGSRWVWPPRKKKEEPGDDEQAYDVRQYRCVACAGVKVIERAFDKAHETKDDPPPGRLLAGDATFFRAVPHYGQPTRPVR